MSDAELLALAREWVDASTAGQGSDFLTASLASLLVRVRSEAERERDEARFRHDKQEQRAEAAEAKVAELTAALGAAAMSLELLAETAGKRDEDNLLRTMLQVRGYAFNRARVAREVLAKAAQPDKPKPA